MTTGLTFIIGAKDMASKVIQGVGSALRDTFVVGAGNLLAGGVAKMMNGLRSMVDSVLEAEEANVKLDAALRGLGMYTPQLSGQMRALAGEIQNLTGASDESVKAQIAQLLTLGVTPSKMSAAVKATAALTAISKDGAMALNAVGRMLNGDITAFEKFSPAVRNATTTQEKFAAIQNLINAGFAQQEAELLTVGGAWGALKGRIGDAVEDMGMAVMEGLGLGKSLKDMQSAMGSFLSSESWTNFVDGIRSGAASVNSVIEALGNQGGGRQTLLAVGEIIKAAFMDGAAAAGKMLAESIGKAFLSNRKAEGMGRAWAERNILGKVDYKDTSEMSYLEVALKKIEAVAAKQTAAKENQPWTVGEVVGDAWSKFQKEQGDKRKKEGESLIIAEAQSKAVQKEHAKKMSERSKEVSKLWEDSYRTQKQAQQEAAKARLEEAKSRSAMLMQEFMDPSKRDSRLAQERTAAETEGQLQREYADIQRKQQSMFGLRGPSDRERQVMDLMAAREQVTVAEDAIQKEIAANTRGLSEKMDQLLRLK